MLHEILQQIFLHDVSLLMYDVHPRAGAAVAAATDADAASAAALCNLFRHNLSLPLPTYLFVCVPTQHPH